MSGENHENKNVNTITSKPFSQMTGKEKARHLGKVLVFVISFGMIFPNIFSD